MGKPSEVNALIHLIDDPDELIFFSKFLISSPPLQFLISLKAGGTGLNLTQADTVIHFDPWWNPAVEKQATDRAYRIGQTNPVFVYKLIMSNSIEQKVFKMQQDKQALVDALFTDKSMSFTSFDEQQMLSLIKS